MQEGHSYLVRLYLDNASQRICASTNFNRFLSKDEPEYTRLQEVDLIVAGKTDIGYKVLIEELKILLQQKLEETQALRESKYKQGLQESLVNALASLA